MWQRGVETIGDAAKRQDNASWDNSEVSQEPFFSRASLYNAQIPDDQDMVENTSAADLRPGSGCNQGRAGGHTKTYADDVENNSTTSTLQKDGKEEPKVWKDVKDGEILKLKNRALQAESSVWSCTPVPSPRSERTPKAPRSRSAPLPRLSTSRWCTWRFFSWRPMSRRPWPR